VVSRDVLIVETTEWNWNNKGEASVPCTIEDALVMPKENTNVTVGNEAPIRKSERVSFPSSRLADYEVFHDSEVTNNGDLAHLAFLVDIEPKSWKQAIDIKEWKKAMMEELKAIEKNITRKLVDLPKHKSPTDVSWVFKIKSRPDGTIAKYKARLVATGFLQKHGINFTEVHAPVARVETVRLLLSIASYKNWKICQLDIRSVFLNGPLEEEVYVRQPPGFVVSGVE